MFAECAQGRIHPVAYELIGKAHRLARPIGHEVHALLIGWRMEEAAGRLRGYGLGKILVCDDPALRHFAGDAYANAFAKAIDILRPSAVLVGATSLGRSLAPRVATRFQTGLTADCTALEMKPDTDLVQIRPAFGGNVMARIVTPHTRPQFATVRYKVFDPMAPLPARQGEIVPVRLPAAQLRSSIQVLDVQPKAPCDDLADAEMIVVAGRGAQQKRDIERLRALARLLGAQMAYTRPLVENRVGESARQIGLSGRTVKAKLILAFGVSGAVQFTAGMSGCGRIVAVNKDPQAPIFQIAHVGIVADVAEFLPPLIECLKGGGHIV